MLSFCIKYRLGGAKIGLEGCIVGCVFQDVNWARAGLGLALLEEAVERKPGAVPVGQQPVGHCN